MTSGAYTEECVSVRTLDNGLTVTLERLPHLHSYSAGVWIKTGSAAEREHEGGLAHFLEHLVFKGTTTRSAQQLMQEVEGRGGQFNAFTSREYTCIYVKMLAEHVHIGIDVLADIIQNATFADLEKERNVILEEIASIEDMPDEYAHDLITLQHWPDHPLGRPVSGSADSVARLTYDDVRAFQQRWYRPKNMVVSVAGNFDEEAVANQIAECFGALPHGDTAPRPTPPAFHSGTQHMHRDIAQSHVCIGFPGVPATAHERYTFELLSNTLGGGSTSRLFDRVREQEGLAYAIYSFQSAYLTAGVFGIYVGVAPQNIARTLAITREELLRMRDEPVSDAELAANREQLKGGLLMALESSFTRMARMARSMLYYGRILPVEELIDHIEAVTAGEINALARRTFTKDNCALLILGPAEAQTVDRGLAL
ncbi:MAG: M16 family metallopeptidase [Candidatus Hydrogenedentota bacterium]